MNISQCIRILISNSTNTKDRYLDRFRQVPEVCDWLPQSSSRSWVTSLKLFNASKSLFVSKPTARLPRLLQVLWPTTSTIFLRALLNSVSVWLSFVRSWLVLQFFILSFLPDLSEEDPRRASIQANVKQLESSCNEAVFSLSILTISSGLWWELVFLIMLWSILLLFWTSSRSSMILFPPCFTLRLLYDSSWASSCVE